MTTIHRKAPEPLVFAGFAAVVALVAVVGALASMNAKDVYADLSLPAWAPPPALFGPVWTVLYVMVAVSGYLYSRAGGDRRGLVWFAVGLVLNAAWTPLFFAAGAYGLALVDIVLLDAATVVTAVLFRRCSPVAALLLVPYLCWIGYATALNTAIVLLN